jgi:hypothetical protein
MESTPVSRASFGTRCVEIRLQSCRRTMSLEAVGLVIFFSPLSSDRVKEPCQPLFLCLNPNSYGMAVFGLLCFVLPSVQKRYQPVFDPGGPEALGWLASGNMMPKSRLQLCPMPFPPINYSRSVFLCRLSGHAGRGRDDIRLSLGVLVYVRPRRSGRVCRLGCRHWRSSILSSPCWARVYRHP